jgi:hypothetical protein
MFEFISAWVVRQFADRTEGLFATDELFDLASKMHAVAMQDEEFWGNQPLWNLYNHVAQS